MATQLHRVSSPTHFLHVCFCAGLILLLNASAKASPASSAEQNLLEGHADAAAATLKSTVAANRDDGAAHLLLCRVYLSEELGTQAATECELALRTLGNSSAAQDWAGRAFGMQANHAGPLSGMRLARRVKAAFAQAVQLDPRSEAAVNDLSEYLVAAPGIVGGSLEEARALADRVASTLPESAHRIRALAAEKSHDTRTAESEFHAAVAVTGSASAYVDLGHFYARTHQLEKAVEALQHGIKADKTRDATIVDAASILNDMHREPEVAISTLRSYLGSYAKSDAAPACRVHVLLGRLLAGTGDKAGARGEFEQSLALAHEYAPAKKALGDL